MVIIIKKETPEAAIRQLLAQLAALHVKGGCVAGEEAILLPLVGETWRLDPNALQALPFVREVRRLTPPYRLAGRAAHPADTVVAAGDARIGGTFCFIAGPCAVESAPQIAAVARSVKAAGAQVLRGGVFKPRTSPYTFQGLGAAGMAFCNLIIYILHLFLSFKFGLGLSLFWGVFESLQCILYSNIELKGVARYIPFAWSMNWVQDILSRQIFNYGTEKIWIAALTTGGLLLTLLWFSHWEGRKNYE